MAGGGIECEGGFWDTYPTIVGNTIAQNTGNNSGGGLEIRNGCSPVLENNTISENYAGYFGGGGMYIHSDCFPTVTNCILYNDYPYDERGEIFVAEGGSVTVSYSDVERGWPGTGNIDACPCFVSPGNYDYRLLWPSPCIDMGKQDSFDPDLTRRDMGAWYFDQSEYFTIYVTPDSYEAQRGSLFGVTYTFVNRWSWSEEFWLLTQAVFPNGRTIDVLGPEQKSHAAETWSMIYENHYIPSTTPTTYFKYRTMVGVPPATLYGEDSFMFRVVP
jgi:hypothetical protein